MLNWIKIIAAINFVSIIFTIVQQKTVHLKVVGNSNHIHIRLETFFYDICKFVSTSRYIYSLYGHLIKLKRFLKIFFQSIWWNQICL